MKIFKSIFQGLFSGQYLEVLSLIINILTMFTMLGFCIFVWLFLIQVVL